ncbi:EAL-associated domain-containing protein [Oceanobacillus sp. J11TS1]|uniref:EAL domain-containing protein n=1 Tax=Oceanobacillus sp. J11TS1 TaxID=2807191 RepID=UPI001B233A6A|nr:EAL-associated domain-containing protein [Oceanobacillus sp. J11TS1]GIO24468.1 putative EAL-domain containing protein YkuI [Oceanobacillus sp. J11TS1]
MDPLDILIDLEQLLPYYKPIIRADNQLISGYEVIAYYLDENNKEQRLDWLFDDTSIPDEFRLEVNKYIHQNAIEKKLKENYSGCLSFYYDAALLVRDNGETFINLLHDFEERGLDLHTIILEIKDVSLPSNMDRLGHIIKYLKTLGVKISIELAYPNSVLNQLAILHPSFIKVDTSFLKDDLLPHLYKDVYFGVSMLSRKIGASLLFKGIRSYNQLNFAWRSGGEYYQGSYLVHPQQNFIEEDCCKNKLTEYFREFVSYEQQKAKAQFALLDSIHETINGLLSHTKPAKDDSWLLKLAKGCESFVFRIYICNHVGLQVSANVEKDDQGNWVLVQESLYKNWSWRPYFFENIMRMDIEKKGILSDLYTDIERSELIRTYAYPLPQQRYIFFDIPYSYLLEKESLL